MKSSSARRFAKALIGVAKEEGKVDAYGKELRSVVAVFKGNDELYKVLLNPMYKIEERRALIGSVSGSLKLDDYVGRFLAILVETRNIRLLEAVAEAYSKLEDESSGRIRAVVEAPTEPDAALLDEIKKKISSAAGKEVLISFKENKALLGGLIVRMENTVLDGSLKTQLELMKEKILEGVV